jgi:hypothetical protein
MTSESHTGSGTVFTTPGMRVTADEPAGFPMAERDWNRFGRHLKALGDLRSWARDAFLVCIGICAGGVIAIVAWLAQWAQIEKPSVIFIAAGVLMLAITLASGGVALIALLMSRSLDQRVRRDADLLYDDMDHVHAFNSEEPQSPERSTHDQ